MESMNEVKGPRSHAEMAVEESIRAGAHVLMDAALKLIESDPHQFGKRKCQTCTAVSSLAGRPFGCQAFAIIKSPAATG